MCGLGVTLVALALRLKGLDWGLPEVYEEATPLHKAWQMWGWGPGESFDPNPRFFNYPSLVIYLHLIWQGLMLGACKLTGAVSSTLDFRMMYEVEKTPVFYAGRLLTALLGAGTVALVFRLGRRLAGLGGAVAAGFLLAVNTFHIDQSQLIAVDVPLAFFTTAALGAMSGLTGAPSRRSHLVTGAMIGLAASAKYTGAVLLVPYFAVFLLSPRPTPEAGSVGTSWRSFLLGVAAAAVIFAATSPFVILDHEGFLRGMAVERDHMRLGHFGLGEGADRGLYFRDLAGTIVGWPFLLAAGAGFLTLLGKRRRATAVVLAVFLGSYLIPLSSWSMKADRYLAPVIPVLAVLAGCGLAGLSRLAERRGWPRPAAIAMGTAAALLVCAVPFKGYPTLLARARPDTRTLALRWMEANLPAGSFILSEYFGPDLLRPATLLPLDPAIEDRLLSGAGRRPVFAVQILPLFQSRPELSAAFYHLDLHPDADYILISDSVRSRYRREPARFATQLGFYREVERSWLPVRVFEPGPNPGPRLALFANPQPGPPYAQRKPHPLAVLPGEAQGLGRDEGFYFFSLGANALGFGHLAAAEAAFREGMRYAPLRPEIARNLVLGTVRSLEKQDRGPAAAAFLDSLGISGSNQLRRMVRQLREDGARPESP